MTKVTIVVPSYNYEHLIRGALDSVFRQTFRDWELVVVDDGSSDSSVRVVRGYQERYPHKVRLYEHENGRNEGLSQTYRLGFEKARGEYVAMLEADDFWHDRESLASRVEILDRHRDVSVVYTAVEMSGEDAIIEKLASDIRKWSLPYVELENRPFYAFPYLLEKNLVLTCSCAMVRKSLLRRLDLTTSHDAWFDWWMLAQLSVMGRFFYIPEKKTTWRAHRTSYLQRFNSRIDLYRESRSFLDRIYRFMKTYAESNHHSNGDGVLIEELRREIRAIEKRRRVALLGRVIKPPIKRALAGLSKVGLNWRT